jgi:leader peptidase (prepilin peptidase)/N-methyltransferase
MDSWLPPLLAAPLIGSFLGVLIMRLPAGRPVGLARSACDSCGHALAWYDLVPLVSYVGLGGVCRYCRAAIGRFHLVVELAAVAVAVSAILVDPEPARLWLDCALGWVLLALAWIDAEWFLLPDALTLPLIPAGLAAAAWIAPEDLYDHALGAVLGYLGFWLIAALYLRLRGREGLGLGDAKLLAAAGAWLGWAALPMIVLIAAIGALIVALIMALSGRRIDATTALPFGPFLALAIWLAWLFRLDQP